MFAKRQMPEGAKVNQVTGPGDDTRDDSANMTDTNGAPGAMDEDGDPALDESPLIQKLTIGVFHPRGEAEPHADLQATIHTSAGFLQKRTIIKGSFTAKRLAAVIAGVASW